MFETAVKRRLTIRQCGHAQCMEVSKKSKLALYCIPGEKRYRDRPHITWQDTIWRGIELTSILRQRMDKKGKNGPPDVLVSGRFKVSGKGDTLAPHVFR